jgi:hypothetical protein
VQVSGTALIRASSEAQGNDSRKRSGSSRKNIGGAFVFTVKLLIAVVDSKMQGNEPSIRLAQRHRFLLALVKALVVVAPE